MRGRMRAKPILPPFTVGAPIPSTCIATIAKSTHPSFSPGDQVRGYLSISQYLVLTGPEIASSGLKVIDNPHKLDPKVYLSTLGMPGLAAYSSFLSIGKPKPGECIFISAAAGAVGQSVGQLAKLHGLTVIGAAGSDSKCEFLKQSLGFDAAFNYKTTPAATALPRLAPKGIDIYYDSVGGEQLDAALLSMSQFGRIVSCGMMSQYNKPQEQKYGVKNLMQVTIKRLTMTGFIVNDEHMGPKYEKEFLETVTGLIQEGKWTTQVSVTMGIDQGPEGFVGMLEGTNLGKAILQL